MKAVQFSGSQLLLCEVSVPDPAPGEARVHVNLAGICNTDLEILKGYAGFTGTLGHEFVGTVEDVNGADRRWIGQRVVGEINMGCHSPDCSWCNKGLERHCPKRRVLGIHGKDGAMAEYLTLPVRNLLPVPDNVADNCAVLVEPLAAGFEILEQVHLQPMTNVAILGDGKLGLLINRALRTSASTLTHIGKHAEKLHLAASPGIKTLLLHDLKDEQFDVIVDATGSVSGFETAIGHVKPRGTLVVKTTVSRFEPIDMTPVVVNEITVLGSRCGRFEPALRALSRGLDVAPLIEKRFPLAQAEKAFKLAGKPGSLKVLLEMPGGHAD